MYTVKVICCLAYHQAFSAPKGNCCVAWAWKEKIRSIAECEPLLFASLYFSLEVSSKFPTGQLDLGTNPYIRQQSSHAQSVYPSLFLLVQQSNPVPFSVVWVFSFLILEQDIFHPQPLVTHYTPHMSNRGWVSSWILSIPCLSLFSSSTHISSSANLTEICLFYLPVCSWTMKDEFVFITFSGHKHVVSVWR